MRPEPVDWQPAALSREPQRKPMPQRQQIAAYRATFSILPPFTRVFCRLESSLRRRAANSSAPYRRKCWLRSRGIAGSRGGISGLGDRAASRRARFAPPYPRHDRGCREIHRQTAEPCRSRILYGWGQARATGLGHPPQVSAQPRCTVRPVAVPAGHCARHARTLRQTEILILLPTSGLSTILHPFDPQVIDDKASNSQLFHLAPT